MSKGFKGMMTAIIALVAAVAFLIGFVATGANNGSKTVAETVAAGGTQTEGNEGTGKETIRDSAGNEFEIPLDTDSVIALNQNAADMLTALGKDSVLTGVSNDTKYPAKVNDMKRYGTESAPDTENIIAAAPGAVIASAAFKDSNDYAKLTEAGIKVVCLDLNNTDTAVEETAKLGLLFNAYDKADEFVTDMENIKSMVAEKTAGEGETKVYWEKNDEYTSVNKDGNENRILKVAAAKSITSDKTESEVKTDAAFIAGQDPAVIVKVTDYDKNVLTLEKGDLKDAEGMVEEIKKRSGLDGVSAVKDNKIIVLSDRITNTPLGSAFAPLYIAKMAHPDKMQDVVPGNYLNEFLNKYWSGSDFKGSLAYAGDVSAEENAAANTLTSGSEGTSLLAGLSTSSTPTGSVLRNSLVSSSGSTVASAGDSRSNLINKVGGTTNNAAQANKENTKSNSGEAKQNDVSTTKDKEQVKDSVGEKITVDKQDGNSGIKSCIVFNSSVYEMIKIMGGQNTVIGVAESLATSADFPELSGKKTFGKWNEPNAEAIIQANPDVVFAYADYGQEAMEKVRKAGITVVSLNFYVPSEIEQEIVTLGKILGNESMANEYVKDLNEIQNLISSRTRSVSKLRCYWEGYTDYTSVSDGSGGNEIISLANLYNVYTSSAGGAYPTISDEWIIQKDPQVIVKMVSGTKNILGKTINNYSAASAKYNELAARPGWSEISAVKNSKVIILNSSVGTTAFGCAVAPLMLAKVAYPEKFADIDVDAYTRNFYKKYWGSDLTGTWRYTHQNLN